MEAMKEKEREVVEVKEEMLRVEDECNERIRKRMQKVIEEERALADAEICN
eukprot:CAMPEP_0202980356 /NCGR_PEP_ID=MMETSP1396-20130829/86304_1 /ASSEMBLY_ACC=CAM_ASM_000872 /TAXON_ID= /ORGANISM="Pseudokeronopsis sp., Strain Brazil" /LENGTH=50 /DNA_ID=CAMNT_0049720291 /DNA_START=331 /DNA_END=483 /DNA_ORIENTATION=+